MDCTQLKNFIGLNITNFPKKKFSKIRIVKKDTPITFDYISNRATIIYNDKGIIINTYCG